MTHTTHVIVETGTALRGHPAGVRDFLPDVRRVFDPIATFAAALTEATDDLGVSAVAWVAVRAGRDEVVIDHVRGELTEGLHRLAVRAGQGLTGSVFASTRLAYVNDYTGAASITHHFDSVITSEGICRVVAAPVVTSETIDAVLAVGRRDEGRFGDRELNRIEGAARRLSTALDVARASRRHARAAALAERRRICEDLHDGVGARLFTISSRVDGLAQRVGDEEVEALQHEVAQLQQLVRSLMSSWHLDVSDDLHAEVQAMVDDFSVRCAVRATCVALGHIPHLDEWRRTAIVRLVGVALANVERHAEATLVTVTLAAVPGRVSVAIANDGPLPGRIVPKIGLTSARDRFVRLGGDLVTLTDDNEGFVVRAWFGW